MLTTSEIGPPHKVESQMFNPAAPLQMSQTDAIITTYVNSRMAGKKNPDDIPIFCYIVFNKGQLADARQRGCCQGGVGFLGWALCTFWVPLC